MKVSLNWLRRLVDLPLQVEEISRHLTDIGLEVEGVEEPGLQYSTLVVGKVLECAPHPDSDHMSVTRVFDGQQEQQVVCGAPNVAAGQTVAFAPLGTVLPLPDGKSLKLKKMKLRGVESCGMICAEDEIGLGSSHAGILVFPDDWQAGTPLVDLGLWDTVLELNVTPNRPDALSHLGVARELAAVLGKNLKVPTYDLQEAEPLAAERIRLSVESGCGCSRYVGRVIEKVQIASSPGWLQNLLTAIGVTPINNVVDITNFVLFELGQPLHSFDLDRLTQGEIHVRRARSGEKLTTIDHQEQALQETDLLICDGDHPACVAGVMGGVESEITEQTSRVFLESAWFDPTVIRKQSKRLGLSTDSSYRFERHIDPNMQIFACDYACALIADLAQGQVLAGRLEYRGEEHPDQPRQVSVRISRIHKVLGISLEADQVRQLLTGIGLSEQSPCAGVPQPGEDSLCFAIPSFRPDLEREVDLIEEVARLVGLDQIPYDMPRFVAEINDLPEVEVLNRRIRYTLSALGLHECLSLRFSSRKVIEQVFGKADESDRRTQPVPLLNPLSEELGVLPVSTLPSLLKAVGANEKNRPGSVRLFEVAKGLFPAPERRSERDPGFDEVPVLGLVLAGSYDVRPLPDRPKSVDFADLKGVLETLMVRLGVSIQLQVPEVAEKWLHPFRQVQVVSQGMVLGYAGEVHPQVLDALEINYTTYACELDLHTIQKALKEQPVFEMFSRQVPTTRDISLEVDERMPQAEVHALITGSQSKNLVKVELKSLYQGDQITAGKKNLLFQCTYQSQDRTLTDDEVNKVHDKLRRRLEQHEAITLR